MFLKSYLSPILFLVLILQFIPYPYIVCHATDNGFHIEITVKPYIECIDEGCIVRLTDLPVNTYYTYVAGAPALPVLKLIVTAPPGYRVEKVRVRLGDQRIIVFEEELVRIPPPQPIGIRVDYTRTQEDIQGVYRPGYSISHGHWRGADYVVVTVYPMDYSGGFRLKYYSLVEITVSYSLRRTWEPFDHEIYCYMRSISINHDQLPIPKPKTSPQNPWILVITRPMFIDELRNYTSLRTHQGYHVIVTTVEDILGSGVSGKDIPEKIRNYINNLYQQSNGLLKYLLIVGDVSGETGWPNGPTDIGDLYPWEVPTRYFLNPDGMESYSHTGNYTPSDWYYVTLDTTWDDDGDGIYGEVGNDSADWAPELTVSRIPVRTEDDLLEYLGAVINYNRTGISRFLGLGSTVYYFGQNGGGDYGSQGDTSTEAIWVKLRDVGLYRGAHRESLYEHYPVLTVIDDPSDINGNLSYSLVIDTIYSYRPDVIVWFAHGSSDAAWRMIWASDDGDGVPEDSEMSWEVFIDTSGLTDSYGYVSGLVIAMSCLTAYYDHTYYNSLGETFVNTTSLWYIGWDRVTWVWLHSWDEQLDPDTWGGLADGYTYMVQKFLVNKTLPTAGIVGYSLMYTKAWSSTIEDTDAQYFRKVWWASTLLGDPVQPIHKANTFIEVMDDYIEAEPGKPVNITFRIYYGHGSPLAGEILYLVNASGGGIVASTTTNEEGYGSFIYTINESGEHMFYILYNGSSNYMPYKSDIVRVYVSPRPSSHWFLLVNTTNDLLGYGVDTSGSLVYCAGVVNSSEPMGFIARIDYNGSISWFKVLNTSDYVVERVVVADDRLYLGGYIVNGTSGSMDAFLIESSLNGSITWARVFSGEGDEYVSDVVVVNNSIYIVGSTNSFGGDYDILFAELDTSGFIRSYRVIDSGGNDLVGHHSKSISYSNGYFYITGYTDVVSGNGYDVLVIKVGVDGAVEWSRVFGGQEDDLPMDHVVDDDVLYIVGSTNSFDQSYDVFIACINVSNGDLMWFRVFGGDGDDHGSSIIVSPDNKLYIIGYTGSYGVGGYDVFVARMSIDGVMDWLKTIGSSGDEYVSMATLTSDQYIVATGYTSSYGSGNYSLYTLLFSSSIGDQLVWAGDEYPPVDVVTYTAIEVYDMVPQETSISPNVSEASSPLSTASIDTLDYNVSSLIARDTNLPQPIPEPTAMISLPPVIILTILIISAIIALLRRNTRKH